MLTRKQLELLRFIHERLKESGVPPSFDEMKDALDLRSKSGIHRLIIALEERGFIRRLPLLLRGVPRCDCLALGAFRLLLCSSCLGRELAGTLLELAPFLFTLPLLAPPLGQLVSSRCNSTARRRSELEPGERVESGGLHVPAQASGLERGTTFIADGGRSQRRGDPVEHRAAYGTPRGLEELLRLMSQPAYRSTLVFLRLSQRVARVAFAL